MYRILKIAHLIGLALFLGSVFSHIVAGALGGPPGSAGFLPAREEISAATRALTLPGLALAIVTGLAIAAAAPGLRRQRWLWLHGALALAIVASSAFLVVPAGKQMLAAARDGAEATTISGSLWVEHIAGGFNILVAVALIAIGVVKPRLRRAAA